MGRESAIAFSLVLAPGGQATIQRVWKLVKQICARGFQNLRMPGPPARRLRFGLRLSSAAFLRFQTCASFLIAPGERLSTGARFDYTSALMKVTSIVWVCLLSVAFGLVGGCASSGSSAAATQKKGHWVTLPAQTGSLIPQRVWVEDTGEANGPGSINNVQNGSAADVQRMQNIPRSVKPPGN